MSRGLGDVYKRQADICVGKMWRFAMLAPVLFITLPYHSPVRSVGMPHLTAIYAAAFSADNLPGKRICAARPPAVLLTAFQFILHKVKYLWLNNGRVAVRYIILRNLALVDLLLLCKEVYRVAFLQ